MRTSNYHQKRKEKGFGYFPFENLPPVTTQVGEEVIECEIGNINIHHTDPIEINKDIYIPLKDNKLIQLQKSDPHINETQETMGKQQPRQEHLHHGEQYPKMEIHRQWTSCTHP